LENLEMMLQENKKTMERQAKVYRKGKKFYIDNEFCISCGQYHPIMEVSLCDGGFYYWYCRTCRNNDTEGKLKGIIFG